MKVAKNLKAGSWWKRAIAAVFRSKNSDDGSGTDAAGVRG